MAIMTTKRRQYSRNIVALTLLIFMAVLTGCSGNKDKGSMSFSIEGRLENAANRMLYIAEMTPSEGEKSLDSVKCDKNGNFKYKGSMTYQTFFDLHCSEYDYIVLLPQDGEKIEVVGDANELHTKYQVKVSPESQLMWQINDYVNQANMAIADIAQQDKRNKETLSPEEYEREHTKTDSLFVAERQTIYLMLSNFIDDNYGSLSTLYAIDAPFNHIMRVFYAEQDFEMFENVLEGLNEKCGDNPHTLNYRTRVERARSARMLAAQQQQESLRIIVE